MTEYEYRPLERYRLLNAEWSEWQVIHTTRGGGRAYLTPGGARGVLSREKGENARRDRWHNQYRDDPVVEREYKIQRRPLGEWEDMP